MSRPTDGLRVVYVDRGPQVPVFLWQDGQVVPDDSFQARQSVHRLFATIVTKAHRDRGFEAGRYVRSGHWLLVETALDGRDSVGRPLAVTLVVLLRGGSRWAGVDRMAGAGELANRILREQELPLPLWSVPDLLEQAEWKSRKTFDRLVGRLLRRAPRQGAGRLAPAGLSRRREKP